MKCFIDQYNKSACKLSASRMESPSLAVDTANACQKAIVEQLIAE